jgi:hypothetical protein
MACFLLLIKLGFSNELPDHIPERRATCSRQVMLSSACTVVSTAAILGTTIWYGSTQYDRHDKASIAGIVLLSVAIPTVCVVSAIIGKKCGNVCNWITNKLRGSHLCQPLVTCYEAREHSLRKKCFDCFLCQKRVRALCYQSTYCAPSDVSYISDELIHDLESQHTNP